MSPDTRRRLRTTAESLALAALCSTIVPVAYVAPSGWQALVAGPAWALVVMPTVLLIVHLSARRPQAVAGSGGGSR